MLGMGRTVDGHRTIHREHMCILEQAGQIVYEYTRPGQAPVGFTLVKHGEREAVFENLSHDFPQRIFYWRNQGVLHARVESATGERSMEWSWKQEDGL